ncbi:hypothetical protein EDC01DRAFT_464669 [Geopyxis carbonaria]|nr:hypothetical protein EDC01DRAFT_464669 [Geopyxis carbonaria]
MIVLPQLAYLGHAFINYTILNTGSPSITPRGSSYYDMFTSGSLSFIPAPPTAATRLNTTGIAAFESDLSRGVGVEILHGGDYFTQRPAPLPGYLELDSTGVGRATASGKLVRFKAQGFIKVNEAVAKIFLRSPAAASMQYGQTDFWEPITFDTGDESLLWLNTRVVISQGRLLVEGAKAYGFELRLWTLVNGEENPTVGETVPGVASASVDVAGVKLPTG